MARRSAAVVLAAALLAAAVAGCGGRGDDPESGPVALPSPGATLPPLTVECTGGVGGVEERLVVGAGGTVTGSHRYPPGTKTTRLDPDERAALADALRRAAARTYQPAYQTDNVWDVFQYRIQIDTVTISADELAIPRPLAAIVDALAPVRTRLELVC
jgi:hypothetical protein